MTAIKSIFHIRYRAILFDAVIFIFNLLMISLLSGMLGRLAAMAGDNIPPAKVAIAAFCCALVFLLPAGAVLKRWMAHQDHPALGSEGLSASARKVIIPAFFISQIFMWFVVDMLMNEAIGDNLPPLPWLYVVILFGELGMTATSAFIFRSYFLSPEHEPHLKWLELPQAAWIGDACIFIGSLGYQALWWYLMDGLPRGYYSIYDFVLVMIEFTILALLFYLPSRIFYLADDPHPKTAWLRMLLANLPILVRMLTGLGA